MGRDLAIAAVKELGGSFNPRARMGRDPQGLPAITANLSFQSTRPHGARHLGKEWKAFRDVFQSTRPHGARLLNNFILKIQENTIAIMRATGF